MIEKCQERCQTTSSDENDEIAKYNCMDRCMIKFLETNDVVNKKLAKMTNQLWCVCLKQDTSTPSVQTQEAQRKLRESPWSNIATWGAFPSESRDWDGSNHLLHLKLCTNPYHTPSQPK